MVATEKRTAVSSSNPSNDRRRHPPAHRLATSAVDALAERKAQDVAVMDLRGLSGAVADYFVLATGASDRQVRALANAVDEQLEDAFGEEPWHREGFEHLQWVLLDYVDLVVHVFSREKRAYYDLERLWGDAQIERVPDEEDTAAGVALLQAGGEAEARG